MDNYGLVMAGSLVIEKVQILPDWGIADTGRILYDLNTNNYWLGSHSLTIGTDGWIPLGITSSAVHSYNIDWDTDMTGAFGKVNASYLPCKYGNDDATNLQLVLDEINDDLTNIKTGNNIAPESIRDYHFDITGDHKITADSIPIINHNGYFSGDNPTIEDSLEQLSIQTAADIRLDIVDGHFGDDIISLSTAITIQSALEGIEDYLYNLNASRVPVYYSGCGCDTTVQFAIESLFSLQDSMKLIDMSDVPAYDPNNRFLKSDGISTCSWTTINADEVKILYPGNSVTNVQSAITGMGTSLTNLFNQVNTLSFTATSIIYTNASMPQLSNVDDALDLVYSTFYHPGNAQAANQVPCDQIGLGNTNVQLALSYLKGQLDVVNSMLPCQPDASAVLCSTTAGQSNTQLVLNYIMGFIRDAIDNHGITYPYFTV